jgi:O-antigen/teichoic acid export membrane protein
MFERRSFFNALKWAYTGSLGDKALSGVFYLVLAGLLGPKDFGIASLALAYVGFLQLFLDQGFAAALIQKKDLTQGHLNAVFWLDIVLSVVLVVISVLVSGTWGAINNSPEVAVAASFLSVTIIFEALTVVPTAILRREMNFRSLTVRTNVSNFISIFVGIVLAWWGAGVWALVCQAFLRDLIALVLLWKLATWRPGYSFSWTHLRQLMGFSIGTFVTQLALFADGHAGSVVLGILFGPAAVGLYRMADKLSATVIAVMVTAVQVVSLPQFSRLQGHPAELKKSVITCLWMSSIASLPALIGLAAVSDPLMAAIGPKWMPAAAALKVLCILGTGAIFTYFTGPLMQALGKARQVAALEWARTFVGIITLGAAGWLAQSSLIETQVLSIALARLVAAVLFTIPFYVYLLLKLANISLREFANSAATSVLAAACVAISVGLFGSSKWMAGANPAALLVVEVAIGGLTGMSALVLIDRQLREFAADTVGRLTSRT